MWNKIFWFGKYPYLDSKGGELSHMIIGFVISSTGFDQAIQTVFPKTEIQKCIIHQIRNSCKFVNYKDLKLFCADMKLIYTAPTEDAALDTLAQFDQKWANQYLYAVKSWKKNWSHLATFFKYPDEIRRLIYTTNPIESLNSCIRKTTSTKRTFPSDDSVLKSVFLAVETRIKKWGLLQNTQ